MRRFLIGLVAAALIGTPAAPAAAQTPPAPSFLSVTVNGSKITGVGTGAGTVAAGNDPRIVAAVQGPLSSALDAAFGSTQGTILYRGASAWAALGPGSAGQVLGSGGANANLAWVTPSGGTSGTQAANTVLAGPASGAAAAPGYRALVPSDAPAPADDCVRVSVASTTSLILKPLGCNTVWVGGSAAVIPAAGVTLSGQTALTSGTLYYVYAQASGGTVSALSLATTGHVTGSDGREYLSSSGSANTAYRLVAMLYTASASAPFVDAPGSRYLLNWFRRRPLPIAGGLTQVSTTSTTELYLGGAALPFLAWGDEPVTLDVYGCSYNSTTNGQQTVYAAIDGANISAVTYAANPSANQCNSHAALGAASLSEGTHTGTAGVFTNGGTATYLLAVRGSTRG